MYKFLRLLWVINPCIIAFGISCLTGCSHPPEHTIQNIKNLLAQYQENEYPQTVEFQRGMKYLYDAMNLHEHQDKMFALFRSYGLAKEKYDSAYYWLSYSIQTPLDSQPPTNQIIEKLNSLRR